MPDSVNDLAGFERWPRRSPFADAAGPLLFRRDGDQLSFAVLIDERHTNARGVAHGGMLSTFADLAMGYAAALATDPPVPRRTVNLSVSFIGSVSIGESVVARPEVLRVGRRIAHVTALLLASARPVASATATLAGVGPGNTRSRAGERGEEVSE